MLLDLGIALDTRRSPLTEPGMVAGTPGYLAPESHVRSSAEPTSDVYQVGLLALFLLTGIDSGRRADPTKFEDLVERLPAEFLDIARCALATDPSQRFSTAERMKTAVESVLKVAVREPQAHAIVRSVNRRSTTKISPERLLGLLAETPPSNRAEVCLDVTTPDSQVAHIVSTAAELQAIAALQPNHEALAMVRLQPPLIGSRSFRRTSLWVICGCAIALGFVLGFIGMGVYDVSAKGLPAATHAAQPIAHSPQPVGLPITGGERPTYRR